MKLKSVFCCVFLLSVASVVRANPVLVVGTPGNSQLSKPTGPSPTLGGVINFDGLTPFTTFDPATYEPLGINAIMSPDGLLVLPFSTQSDPNELFDDSADGTADIEIDLAWGTSAIGIGIADSDPVSITLQALAANGSDLGQAFTVNLAATESTINTGNGYYVLSDSSNDIFGLRITQSVGSPNFSGLAIDDLQTAPEPSSLLLVTAGIGILAFVQARKRV